VWDGSDVWMLPGLTPPTTSGAAAESVQSRLPRDASSPQIPVPTTRAEALLAQLRKTPGVLRVDPGSEERSAPDWEAWLKEQWSEKWKERTEKEDNVDLVATKEALVPDEMDEETFWKRYFFRVHQIERDEERRKALLNEATAKKEETFSWDDEEEQPTIALPLESTTPRASSVFEQATVHGPHDPSSGAPSPRFSSDDSYDVVGVDSGAVSVDEHAKSAAVKKEKNTKAKTADESEESDWE